MAKQEETDDDSESGEETRENSSSEELEEESNKKGSNSKEEIPEYEKQRLRRMKENSAIMEAMGLRNMASNLTMASSVPKKQSKNLMMGKKGKEKVVQEDEDYIPDHGEDEFSSVSEEEEEEEEEQDDDDDEDFVGHKVSGSRSRKVKNDKQFKSKKKVSLQKLSSTSDFIDEDAELMQAIALSLKESGVSGNVDCGASQGGGAKMIDSPLNGRKGNAHIQEDTGKRKRKKPVTSRVQMTEDEVIMHFFQFDEAGKGGIRLRDLQRVVNSHDFTWTDSEMEDMIRCFDSDGDGKLSLADFRAIVSRCNMRKESENALPVGNS